MRMVTCDSSLTARMTAILNLMLTLSRTWIKLQTADLYPFVIMKPLEETDKTLVVVTTVEVDDVGLVSQILTKYWSGVMTQCVYVYNIVAKLFYFLTFVAH